MNRHAHLLKLGLSPTPIFTHKDTILYTSLISSHTHSNPPKALHIFLLMLHNSVKPTPLTFSTISKAISSSQNPHFAQSSHTHLIKSGFIPNNPILETSFVNMYSKCHLINYALQLFDEMPQRNLVTYNTMIHGCFHNEMETRGFELFCEMKCKEFYVPDEFTAAIIFSGCARVGDVILGMQVHGFVIVNGLEFDCVSSIGNMYFRCGEVGYAERVLDGVKDGVVELIKMRGYVLNERYADSLKCVSDEVLKMDYTIIVPLLSSCGKLCLVNVGKQVHGRFITSGSGYCSEDCGFIGSALIDMYSKCNTIDEARKVFDNWHAKRDITHWNLMISCYIYNGLVEDARTLMENMPEKNVVSWTTMIQGYVQNGMPQKGLKLLTRMHSDEKSIRVDGNCFTFVVSLEACRSLSDLAKGKQIHAKLIRTMKSSDVSNVIVGTALVDMYCKSGCLSYAQTMFDLMVEKNVVTWTSIIMGYAVHGFGLRAIEIFEQMMELGFEPNLVTFVSVVTACSHCGLVEEGLQYFKLMR